MFFKTLLYYRLDCKKRFNFEMDYVIRIPTRHTTIHANTNTNNKTHTHAKWHANTDTGKKHTYIKILGEE